MLEEEQKGKKVPSIFSVSGRGALQYREKKKSIKFNLHVAP